MDNFFMKTQIFSGSDSLNRLCELKNKRIFFVSDGFLLDNGQVRKILEILDPSNKVTLFTEIYPDSPIEYIIKATRLASGFCADTIIVLGGGSAIDTAKAIMLSLKKLGFADNIKLIAIPTTSGTGSECTAVTVISDPERGIKQILHDLYILPDEAILDPRFTTSLPPQITAYTGIDAISHALEAYVGLSASVYSDAFAEKAMRLIKKSLLACYINGNDAEARLDMHRAANLAGIAFNSGGLGLCHAIAHAMGGSYHIPHGLANALLLEQVIDYNGKDARAKQKYAGLARNSGIAPENASDDLAVRILTEFITNIKISTKTPLSLSAYGISKENFEARKTIVSQYAVKDICMLTNPRTITRTEVEDILDRLF